MQDLEVRPYGIYTQVFDWGNMTSVGNYVEKVPQKYYAQNRDGYRREGNTGY